MYAAVPHCIAAALAALTTTLRVLFARQYDDFNVLNAQVSLQMYGRMCTVTLVSEHIIYQNLSINRSIIIMDAITRWQAYYDWAANDPMIIGIVIWPWSDFYPSSSYPGTNVGLKALKNATAAWTVIGKKIKAGQM